jgi:replication initiator protein RepSA
MDALQNRDTRPTTTVPGQLLLPAGTDPVLADLIGQVNSPDHPAWMRQVERVGGCTRPLHLRGSTRVRDTETGLIDYQFSSLDAPGGVLLVRCRNRRATVCPSCAYLYQGDIYQLVRAGLDGGKGIPDTVRDHPRVFATLTAPSFGAVHTLHRPGPNGRDTRPCRPRHSPACDHGRPTRCFTRHAEDERLLGSPLCPDCYDYRAAIVWQASVGALWHRFTTGVPRRLAALSGRSVKEVTSNVRISYVKVVEYQRRGLVHIHTVIRADARPPKDADDPVPVEPPPAWLTAELLAEAVPLAAAAVIIRIDGGGAGTWTAQWGNELDVHVLSRSERDDDGSRMAAYIAKYASKGTEDAGWNPAEPEDSPRAAHAMAMIRAAWSLAEVDQLAHLKLGRWARELGYRGHVSSRSRHYSTTLAALRQARSDHLRASTAQPSTARAEAIPRQRLSVESKWELVGFGYTRGQALIAADIARDQAINRTAAREAGAARTRAGGRGRARRDTGEHERGAR